MTEEQLNNLKRDYKKGFTYKQLQQKYDISPNKLKYIIQQNKWKRKSNRSKVQKGNQNSVGNSGGHAPKRNQNAVTTRRISNNI